MINIGTKIKKVRELRNYTQEYMAERLAMSQVNYSRIERNEVKIKQEKLKDIADILGIDLEALLAFDEKNIFNIMNNQISNQFINNSGTVNTYSIDDRIEKLYQDKVNFLEEKIATLSAELNKMKEQ
jgi:transcriptional regulator with XRE-family HTH domain